MRLVHVCSRAPQLKSRNIVTDGLRLTFDLPTAPKIKNRRPHDIDHESFKKMAECASDSAGRVKIPLSGETTPEYNAVRKSYGDIEPAIVPDDFISEAHSCELIPTRNPSSPPLEVILKEISRDPVNYYSLQHVVATLNVGNRFDNGIGTMETTFQCKDIIMILI